MDNEKSSGQLYRLARLYNVQTAFYGMRHRRYTTAADSLAAVLKALGAPVASPNDVPAALRQRTQDKWRQIMEPVTVAWDGERPVINITLPAGISDIACAGRLELESGEMSERKFRPGGLPVSRSAEIEGRRYEARELTLAKGLPFGYHKFTLQAKAWSAETMIISAPRRAFSPPDKNARGWGAFLPLYALRTKTDWGSGDYSGLGALADRVAGEGGDCVGTLPLLPVFLDRPFDPSPYAPVSRLLWNEFYIDVDRIPELSRCPTARELRQSSSFRAETARLRGKPLVDYRSIMALKRRVLEQLSKYVIGKGEGVPADFRRFIRENPRAEDYARFRAVMEKQEKSWGGWPQRLRDGEIRETDYDEVTRNYHLYAQWQARQQAQDIAKKARREGVRLYFDMPVGVHPDGYDVWRHRGIFLPDTAAGAPPDAVFTSGQNWGFPPLHPEKIS
jgi:4-alpha-glucanotransferase